jgi:hypothetical protein
MAGFLNNCKVNTKRAQATAQGGASAPTPYLRGVTGCLQAITATDYHLLPESAIETLYVMTCWPDTTGVFPDIHFNDLLTLYELDGVTPWPGANANEVFIVTLARKILPKPLSHMKVFIGRYTAGGPVYAG